MRTSRRCCRVADTDTRDHDLDVLEACKKLETKKRKTKAGPGLFSGGRSRRPQTKRWRRVCGILGGAYFGREGRASGFKRGVVVVVVFLLAPPETRFSLVRGHALALACKKFTTSRLPQCSAVLH